MNDYHEIIIEELEKLLKEESPDEVAYAKAYVNYPEDYFKRPGEKIAGIPIPGEFNLLGPVILPWLIGISMVVARDLGSAIYKKIIDKSITALFDKISKILKKKKDTKINITTKEDTIIEITKALIKAGWNAGEAGKKAEEVWRYGENLGKRFIENAG